MPRFRQGQEPIWPIPDPSTPTWHAPDIVPFLPRRRDAESRLTQPRYRELENATKQEPIMKIWKVVGLAVPGVVAIALIYPGIPGGSTLKSNLSKNYAVLSCYYLQWTGWRTRDIDLSSEIKNGGISATNGPCYRWANWSPSS
jgi:hypothetical protein